MKNYNFPIIIFIDLLMTPSHNIHTIKLYIYIYSQGIISNIITLLNVRAAQTVLDNLNEDKIDPMIVHLSTDWKPILQFY